jgi:hypothetical protein
MLHFLMELNERPVSECLLCNSGDGALPLFCWIANLTNSQHQFAAHFPHKVNSKAHFARGA